MVNCQFFYEKNRKTDDYVSFYRGGRAYCLDCKIMKFSNIGGSEGYKSIAYSYEIAALVQNIYYQSLLSRHIRFWPSELIIVSKRRRPTDFPFNYPLQQIMVPTLFNNFVYT